MRLNQWNDGKLSSTHGNNIFLVHSGIVQFQPHWQSIHNICKDCSDPKTLASEGGTHKNNNKPNLSRNMFWQGVRNWMGLGLVFSDWRVRRLISHVQGTCCEWRVAQAQVSINRRNVPDLTKQHIYGLWPALPVHLKACMRALFLSFLHRRIIRLHTTAFNSKQTGDKMYAMMYGVKHPTKVGLSRSPSLSQRRTWRRPQCKSVIPSTTLIRPTHTSLHEYSQLAWQHSFNTLSGTLRVSSADKCTGTQTKPPLFPRLVKSCQHGFPGL